MPVHRISNAAVICIAESGHLVVRWVADCYPNRYQQITSPIFSNAKASLTHQRNRSKRWTLPHQKGQWACKKGMFLRDTPLYETHVNSTKHQSVDCPDFAILRLSRRFSVKEPACSKILCLISGKVGYNDLAFCG